MNLIGLLISFGISFGFLLVAMTVHEFSHGYVAYRLGDNTAKNSGRLTLNPLAHMDPIGTFLLPLVMFIASRGQFVFGAAKPVPINYWALKNPKRDILWIGLSGPLSNFVFAVLLSVIWRMLPGVTVLAFICGNLILINVILGVFNLIPIPPLDGSRILMSLLPEPLAEKYSAIEPYGFFIIMALLALGVLDIIIWPFITLLLRLLTVS